MTQRFKTECDREIVLHKERGRDEKREKTPQDHVYGGNKSVTFLLSAAGGRG